MKAGLLAQLALLVQWSCVAAQKGTKGYDSKIDYFLSNTAVGCEYYPCKNGGTCMQLEAGMYMCKCPNMFGGRNCEIALSTCTCKGASHCRTFDRANIDYAGKCRFLLSHYNGDEPISVYAGRSAHAFNPDVVYIAGIDLLFGKYNLSFSVERLVIKVKVNGINVELPHSVEGDSKFGIFHITSSSVRFVTDFGFRLDFNRYWYVKVVVPKDFTKRMSGLCGNLDGDASNDLSLKDGKMVAGEDNAGIKVGNSYVEDLKKTFTECQLQEPPKPIPCSVGTLFYGKLTCRYLQPNTDTSYLFQNCLDVFDPVILAKFYDVCMEDITNTCDVQAARDVVRVFATACNLNSLELPEWTETVEEPCKCPGPKQTCSRWSSGCIETCKSLLAPQPLYKPHGRCILENYNSVCVCPENTVFHDGSCILPAACGCVDADTGVVHPLKATWWSTDCSVERTCVSNGKYDSKWFACAEGTVCEAGSCKSCTSESCNNGECVEMSTESFCLCKPGYKGEACDQAVSKATDDLESATCACSIGQHCSTFDGADLSYQGACRYLLTAHQQEPVFAVHVSSVFRSNTYMLSYPRAVELKYREYKVVLSKNGFSASATIHVSVNALPIEVPFETDHLSIVHNGDCVEVRTKIGLTISYNNHWRVKVQVDKSRYAGKLTGVCGDSDSYEVNDFVTAKGDDLIALEKPGSKVIDTYVVNCPDNGPAPTMDEECANPATEKCETMMDRHGPFKQCLVLLGKQRVGHFALNCMEQVKSSCNDMFACESLENFAKNCQEAGASMAGNWRETVSCPSGCPDPSMGRAIRTTACRTTCSRKACTVVPNIATDICICPTGKVLFSGACILAKDCGCIDENGSARQLSEVWLTDKCRMKRTCGEHGEVSKEAFLCPKLTKCIGESCSSCSADSCEHGGECVDVAVDGEKLCKCKPGFSGLDCSLACNDKMDLVIVVDNTQSQCKGDTTFDGDSCDQWKKVLNYVSKILTFLQIGAADNNIALVKLSATPVLIGRGFVSSKPLMELLQATHLAFNYDSANIAAALRFLKQVVFTSTFDRPSAPNYVLFVLNSWNSLTSQVSEELAALDSIGAKFTAVVTSETVKEDDVKTLVGASTESERSYFMVPSVRAIESTKKYVQKAFNLCAAGKSVTCSCLGDGRCRTFDKLKIEYKGYCRFLMLEHNSDLGAIKVWLKSFNPYPSGHLSYPKCVEIELNGQKIVLERYIKSLGSLVNLWVNGIERSVPFSGPDFYVYYNGDAVEVSTSLGVTISHSKLYNAKVVVNPTFKNEVRGFCGNYDDETQNDLSLQDGTQVEISGNVTSAMAGTLVGDSYADPDDPDAIDGFCSFRGEKPSCSSSTWNCKKMISKKRAFAPCFAKYPDVARKYKEMCEDDTRDLCLKGSGVYCQTFAEFDSFCRSKNIYLDWRSKSGCECLCPPDMLCSVRAPACLPTCSNPKAAKTCLLPDVGDTCVCPEGKVLSNQQCINPIKCGCRDTDGKERNIDETWTSGNCTKKHTCTGTRTIETGPFSCALGSYCEDGKCVGCKRPMDILFLVDESGSVCHWDPNIQYNDEGTIIGCDSWTYMLQAMANILKDLNIGPEETQVAVIKFSTKASLSWNLDSYKTKPALLRAIEGLRYMRGFTNMAAALRVARTEVFNSPSDRPYAQNMMLIITDGKATIEKAELPIEAFKAFLLDITQVAIGITDSIDELSLMKLSDPPHKFNTNYFIARGFDEVEFLRKKLQKELKICPDLKHYICECWGDVHCKSFDGKNLDYPAVCKTSLSDSSSLNYPFDIYFGIHRSNRTDELSYVNYVEIQMGADVIKLEKGSTSWSGPLIIKLNGELIEVPFKNEKFAFDYSGEYLQFLTEYGLMVGFSDRSNFFIDLPKTLSFSVKGFCGNFDDDPHNDILLSNNKIPNDIINPGIELGNSFLAFEESLVPTCKAKDLPILECKDSQVSLCTNIINKAGPFGACIFLLGDVEAGRFFQQCLDDYKRSCNRNGICRSLQDFSRKCRQNGWVEETASQWRIDVKCSCSCTDPDMFCRPLGPSCIDSCFNQTAAADCKGPPAYDVCVCSGAGKVMRQGKCVDISECGCTDKAGKVRKVGENFLERECTLNSSCVAANLIQSQVFTCPDNNQCLKNKCTPCEPKNPCMNEAECVVKLVSKFLCVCPPGFYGRYCEKERKTGVCRVWAGVGISTYDQAFLEYDGLNKFLLSAGVFDRKDFYVFAKNYRACEDGSDQVTRLRYVEFVYEGFRVHLEKDEEFPSAPLIAVVNGRAVSIPYKCPSFAIEYVAGFVEIKSFFGLIVAFSASSTAMIQVPSIAAFTANVKGVCGNFDDSLKNDFKTNFGVDAYYSETRGADIANSYDALVLFKEEDPCVFEDECGEELILNMERCRKKPDKCDSLNDLGGPFMWCLLQLDAQVVEKFVQTCKKNFKRSCKGDNDLLLEASVCDSMEAFMWLCQSRTGWSEQDVAPLWREEMKCPCTIEDMKCNRKAVSCLATCSEPLAAKNCNLPPTFYGPTCSNNNHLLFEGRCIDAKACGCVDDEGRSRKIGEGWMSADCSARKKCKASNKVVTEAFRCEPPALCTMGKCVGCGQALDVVFIVHNRLKNCARDWKFVKQFLADMVKLMRIEESSSSAAVILLSSAAARTALHQISDTKSLIKGMEELGCEDSETKKLDLISSMDAVRKIFSDDRRRVPDHVIILTESSSFRDEHLVNAELYRLKVRGVNVVSVGVGSEVAEEAIKALSSQPSLKGKNFFMLDSYSQLGPLRTSLQDELLLCPDTKPARCSCYGDVHCSTFDQLHLSYQGVCKFLLAESVSVFDDFKVFLKGTNVFGVKSKSFVEYVEVVLAGHTVMLRMKDKTKKSPVQALVDGKVVGIPSKFPEFIFRLNGKYSELVTSFGLIVGMSSAWSTYVEVKRTYSFYTNGFCGNYDDDVDTDLLTSKAVQVVGKEAGKTIGDSYVVNSNDDSCFDMPAPAPACDLEDLKCKYIKDSNGPLKECAKSYSSEQLEWFEEECLFDFKTRCKHEIACDFLETFVDFCRRDFDAVSVDAEWRKTVNCSCACLDPSTQTCQREGPGCINTCDDMSANSETCGLPDAFDVCRCSKPSQVFFQGRCIEKSLCGCKDDRDQTVHEMDSMWLNEGCTEQSHCEGNKIISRHKFSCPSGTACYNKKCTACRPNPCKNGGKCSDVDDNQHVCQCPSNFFGVNCQFEYKEHRCVCQDGVLCRTFQGLNLDFSTNKKWLLTSNDQAGHKFKVYAKAYKEYEEDDAPQEAYLRYIQVVLGDAKVQLEWDDVERSLFSSISASVSINGKAGKRLQVPYTSKDFSLEWSGRYLKLSSQSGLTVSVSSRGLAIIGVKADHSYALSGFCSTKTEDKGDEFVVADEDYEIVYDENKLRRPDEGKECEISASECGRFVVTGAFYHCLNRLEKSFVDALIGRCKRILVERCEMKVVCALLEDLAIRCAEVVGVDSVKDWRNENQCPCQAREDLKCLPTGPSCISTCSQPTAASNCDGDVILDSYACATPGHVLSAEGACVANETCGCVDEEGGSRVLTEQWLTGNCSLLRDCKKANDVSDSKYKCDEGSECLKGYCYGCDKPMDVAFLIDESSAICHNDPTAVSGPFSVLTCDNFQHIQQFVIRLIKYYDLSSVNVGLLKFADQANIVFGLDSDFDKEKLVSLALTTPYNGGSRNAAQALRRARRKIFQGQQFGDRSMAPDVIIMVMNSMPTTPDYRLSHELHEARIDGTKVIWVGVSSGEKKEMEFLGRVAKADQVFGQQTYVVKDFKDLAGVEEQLEEKLCGAKWATCGCLDGSSCHTFDQLPLRQTISCPFSLAKDKSDGSNLEVTLENTKARGVQTLRVVYKEHLIELVNAKVEKLSIDIVVKVNGLEIEIPYKVASLFSIYYKGMAVEVSVGGLLVKMAALGSVAVTAPSRRQLDFSGFCGNYDGDADNDLVTKEGKVVEDNVNAGEVIANSYIVEKDSEALCFMSLENFIDPADCAEVLKKCEALVALPVYKECEEAMGEAVKDFHQQACETKTSEECISEVACHLAEDFINTCRGSGVADEKLKGWRSILNCPCKCFDKDKECKLGKSSACLKSCPPVQGNASEACKLGDAWDVCRCKDPQQVLFKGRCVEQDQCGCVSEEDGRSYELDTSWLNQNCTTKVTCQGSRLLKEEPHQCPNKKQCHKSKCYFCRPECPCENEGECIETDKDYYCKCKQGFFGKNCEKKNDMAVCWCWLGTDCLTFDGALWPSVTGLSRFLLVSSTNAKCPFKVFLKNYRPCDEPIAVIRYVEIEFGKEVFRFEKQDPASTTSKIVAYLNGRPVALPLTTEQYIITYEGHSIYFENFCGLQVSFSGPPVQVRVPTHLSSKVTGLCGDFDNDPLNDLPPSKRAFNVSDAYVHEPEQEYDFLYDECVAGSFEPCESHVKTCDKLKDTTSFSVCLKLLGEPTLEGFYQSCLATATKACATKMPVKEVLCELQREFARACKYHLGFESDVTPLFHTKDQCACPKLEEDSTLKCQAMTKSCVNTCQEPKAETDCLKTETAYNVLKCLKPSQLLFKGRCVEASHCGCVDNKGRAKEVGETWLDSDCTSLLKCTHPSKVETLSHNCTAPNTCHNSHCLGCDQAKDIVILLQASATICQNDPSFSTSGRQCKQWKKLLGLLAETLSPLDLAQSAVAVISFAEEGNLEFNFKQIKDQKALRSSLTNLKISEKTGANLNKALISLESVIDSIKERSHISKHVIIVTTSAFSGSEEDKAGVSMRLDRLKLVGTNVVSLGAVFDFPLQEAMVRSYASAPNEKNKNYFHMESFSDQFTVRSAMQENLQICDTKPAKCSCFGDVHCSTFDHLHLAYQGVCKFLLAEYPNSASVSASAASGLPAFSVLLKGSNLFGFKTVTWADTMEVRVFNKTILLRKEKISTFGPVIPSVDGIDVAVPSIFKDFQFRFYGEFTQLVTSFGLVVGLTRDWRTSIEVPRSYAFSTHGFCGNYDGNMLNDRALSDGVAYTIREDMGVKIGDSYVVPQEDDGSQECFEHPDIDRPENSCYLRPDKCSWLSDAKGLFAECYRLFNEQRAGKAESYTKDCMLDLTTVCKEGILCHVVQEYVAECRSLGGGEDVVPADWRERMECPCMCSDLDQECLPVTSACTNSCLRPEAVDTCEFPPVHDVCVCKNVSEVMFQGACVAKEDCGCYDDSDGTEHKVDSTWISRGCLQNTTCLSVGNMSRKGFECPEGTSCHVNLCTACQPNPCGNGGVCKDAEDNRFKCFCTRGFSGERCEIELSSVTCRCVRGTVCETFDGYELLNTRISKWTLFKAKKVKLVDGVDPIYSEVEVRARNVEDCARGEVWVQYLEVLLGGYVVRLERILGAKLAPARATVNDKEVVLPYESPSHVYTNTTTLKNNKKNTNNLASIFTISIYASYIRISTQFGLQVEFNSLGIASIHASIEAEQLSGSVNVEGFCGNNDGVLRNDVLIGGKSKAVVEEGEYDWEVGNLLAAYYEVDIGDEILGTCDTAYNGKKSTCDQASPCDKMAEKGSVFEQCVWTLDHHHSQYLLQQCQKRWAERCELIDTCSSFEDLAAACSTKLPAIYFKNWRQQTNCSCDTGLKELSCEEWGSPCQSQWQTNPLMCLDTPTHDVVFCNSVSRYPGPCGPKDCIDQHGEARLYGEEWLSWDCKKKYSCTEEGMVWRVEHFCPEFTQCSQGYCIGCDSPKDVLLVIDESSSICGNKPTCAEWQAILIMISDVIKMVDISKNKTRVGLIKFSDEARVVFDLGQFLTKKSLLEAIMSLKSVGGVSNIAGALHVAREHIFDKAKCTGKRGLVPNLLVLITSDNQAGHDENYHVINHEIFNLRLLDVRTIVLGLSVQPKYVTMFPLISARPHKVEWDYFMLGDSGSLKKIERSFTDSISHCEFQTSTCSCVGNFHCTTFDQAYLSYTSECPFLLTQFDLLGHPMKVIVGNQLDIEGVLSAQRVEVHWREMIFTLENNYQTYTPFTGVFVGDVLVEVPYVRPNISIQYFSMNAELVLGFEDQVALVGAGPQGAVYVTVPYKLQLGVKGFCGNYDNDDGNDYVTATMEDVLISPDPGALIGASYAIEKDTSECQDSHDTIPCASGVEKCKQIVGKSSTNQFFLNECNRKLPNSTLHFFYKACLKSYAPKCLSRVACRVIGAYVEECRLAGVEERTLAGWKQLFGCPCECGNSDMVCVAVARSCINTCPNPSPQTFSIIRTTEKSRLKNDTCKLPNAKDFCDCSKAGQVLFKGRCVEQDQCGCVSEEDGRSYELHTSWLSRDCAFNFVCLPTHKISKVTFKCSNNMQCNNGVCSVCYPKSPCKNYGKCEEMGKGEYKCVCRAGYYGVNCEIKTEFCLLHGNGHANTFDWAALTFRSTCKFLLVKSQTAEKMSYEVYTRYEKRQGAYIILYMEVVYAGHVVRLSRREVEGDNQLVATINGIQVNNLPVKEKFFQLSYSNRKIVYEAKFGLVVSLTRSWIAEVVLTAEAKDLSGYCGNFDGDIDNDFLTKEKDLVKDDKDPGAKIGSSYVVEGDPERDVGETCAAEASVDLKEIPKEAKRVCSIISLSKCAQRLEAFQVSQFEEVCVQDFARGCNAVGHEVYCQDIEAFAEVCQGIGFPLKDWMATAGCACTCPFSDQQCISSQASSSCVPTCGHTSAQEACTVADAYDVCSCGAGQVLHNGKCINELACACVDDKGLDRKIGEEWFNDLCSLKSSCNGPGSVVSEKVTSCSASCKIEL